MEFLLGWLAFSIVVGMIADSRGRGGLFWFFISIILSPLLGVIMLLLMPVVAKEPTPETHVKCPECAELVLKEAKLCKHCGTRLIPQL